MSDVRANLCSLAETYDIIVDTAGTARFSRCKALLSEGGRFLMVLGGLPQILRIPWVWMTSDQQQESDPWAGGRARGGSAFSRGAGKGGRIQTGQRFT